MKKGLLLIPLALLLAISLVAIGCPAEEEPPPPPPTDGEEPPPPPPPEEVFEWRWQCGDVPGETEWEITDPLLEQLIEEASGGRVQVERYPHGTICYLEEMVEATTMGAIEMSNYPAGYASEIAPSSLASEMPMGVRDAYELYELHHAWGMLEVQRQEYAEHGLYLLAPLYCGMGAVDTTFPVNTVDDFDGKLMWVIPNLLWLAEFGAAPTEVPDFDMYMATKLGTIDGFWWPYKGLKDYNHREVVTYVMRPRLAAAVMHVVVNMDAWNALGPELQMRIQDRVDARLFEGFVAIDEFTEVAVAEAEDYGIQFITLPEADVAKLNAASRGFWDEITGLSPATTEAIGIYKAWMEYRGIPW